MTVRSNFWRAEVSGSAFQRHGQHSNKLETDSYHCLPVTGMVPKVRVIES
jgi:hypothetical protein